MYIASLKKSEDKLATEFYEGSTKNPGWKSLIPADVLKYIESNPENVFQKVFYEKLWNFTKIHHDQNTLQNQTFWIKSPMIKPLFNGLLTPKYYLHLQNSWEKFGRRHIS